MVVICAKEQMLKQITDKILLGMVLRVAVKYGIQDENTGDWIMKDDDGDRNAVDDFIMEYFKGGI